MKRFIIGLILASAVYVTAGEPSSYVKVSASNVPTNAISTNVLGVTVSGVTTATKVTGEITGVVVDFSGAATPDIDLDLITASGKAIPISRTIFSIDDITADREYDVKNIATTTAGVDITLEPSPIILLSDEITLLVSDANKTNINVSVIIMLK